MSDQKERPRRNSVVDAIIINVDRATLGDIRSLCIFLLRELAIHELHMVEEVQRRFVILMETFINGMVLFSNGPVDPMPWEALNTLPDECSLPDKTREEFAELLI